MQPVDDMRRRVALLEATLRELLAIDLAAVHDVQCLDAESALAGPLLDRYRRMRKRAEQLLKSC